MAAEAILIAMTMGADKTSEFAKKGSSTAWRFPGVGRVSAVSRRLSLSGLGAQTWRLSGSGCPDLASELLDGERVAQKGVPSVFPRRSHRLCNYLYSTRSFSPVENEAVIDATPNSHPGEDNRDVGDRLFLLPSTGFQLVNRPS